MKAQWTVQGSLQRGWELRLVLVGPRVLPCEGQVAACQLSHGNWPHADMVLQLRDSFTSRREALGNSSTSITQRDGYLFESGNFTDGLPMHSETRHGATCLHSLPFGLRWFLPWARSLLGTARSRITGWPFCSPWPGRRISHIGTGLSQCLSVGYEDGTQLFVSLSQNPSFLLIAPQSYWDSIPHLGIILSKILGLDKIPGKKSFMYVR